MWMSEGGVDLPPKFDKKYSRPRAYPHNGRARKATLYIRTSSCLANRCVAAACVRKIERDEMRSFSVQQIDAERSREPERAGRTEERGTRNCMLHVPARDTRTWSCSLVTLEINKYGYN